MAVGLSSSEAQMYLDKLTLELGMSDVSIGCINSTKNVTLTGNESQLDVLQELLHGKSIFARKLNVGVAYHSPYMNTVAEEYRALIENLEPGIPVGGCNTMLSSVTGRTIKVSDLSEAKYWVQNMVSPVKFAEAMSNMLPQTAKRSKKLGARKSTITVNVLLELGPHSALQGPVRDILTSTQNSDIKYMSALTRQVSALATSLDMAGRLYCLGCPLNFRAIHLSSQQHADAQSVLTDLPEYPFNHTQSYWHESRLSKGYRFRKNPRNLLLGTTVPDWNPLEARWRNIIKASENPWIEHHKVSECPIAVRVVLIEKDERLLPLSRSRYGCDGNRSRETNGQKGKPNSRIFLPRHNFSHSTQN